MDPENSNHPTRKVVMTGLETHKDPMRLHFRERSGGRGRNERKKERKESH